MTWPAAAGRVSWRGSRNVRSTSTAVARQASPADSQPTSLTPQSSTPRSSYASLCQDPAELEVLHELVRRRQSTQSITEDGEAAACEEEVAARRRRGRWGSTSSGKEQKHTGAGQAASAGQSAAKVDAVSAKSIMKKEKSEKPSVLDDFQRLKSEFQVAKAHLQTVLDEPATPSPQKFRGNIDELWEPETQPDPYPQETPEDAQDVSVDWLTDTFGKQCQRREPRKSERPNVACSGEKADRIKQDLELVEQQLATAKSQADRIQQQRQALLERAHLEQHLSGAEVGFGASFPEASSASWAGLESEPSCTEYAQDCTSVVPDENEYVLVKQAWMQADAELNAAALQIQAVYRGCRARKEVKAHRARLGDSWVKVEAAEARIDEMLQLFGTESPVHVNHLASIADSPEVSAHQPQAAAQPCSPLQQAATAGPTPKRKLSSKRAGPAGRSSASARTQSTGKSNLQADTAERRLPNSWVGSKRASTESCSAEPKNVSRAASLATPRGGGGAAAPPGNAEIEHEDEVKLQDKRKSSAQELLAGGTHVYPRARKFAAATASKQQEGTQERSGSIVYPRARRSSAAANASPHTRKASTMSQSVSSKLAERDDQPENAVTLKKRLHKTLSKSSSAPISSMPAGTPSPALETQSSTKSTVQAPETQPQQTTEIETSNLEDSSMLTPRSGPQPHPYPAYRASFRDLKSYLPAPPDSSAARTAPAPEPPPAPTRAPPRNSSASRTPPRKVSQSGTARLAPSIATKPRGSSRSGSRVRIKPPASPERPEEPPPPPWSSSRHAMASSDEDVQTADVRDGGRIPQGVPARTAHVKAEPNKGLGGRSASWRTAESLKLGREQSTAHSRQAKLPSSESEASSDEELALRRQPVKRSSKIPGAKPLQRRLEKVPASKSETVRAESVSSTTVSESETVPLPPHQRKIRASNLSDPYKAHVESRRESNRSGHPKAAPQHHRASNSSGVAKDSAENCHRSSSSQPQCVTAESRRESKIPRPSRGSSRTSRQSTAAKPRASGLAAPSAEEMALAGAGLPDGQVYMGFRNKDGGREGFGVMRSKDGQIYTGQWQGGKRNGQGTLFFEGGVFEGQWVDNSAHGMGMISHKNGDIFKGEYKDNKKCGPGTYTWKDGSEEKGDYLDGQRHGWHHMKRDGEDWDIYYERGNMVSANKRGSAAEAVLDLKRRVDQNPC